MQKAARRGDLCSGHDDCGARPAQRGSADVTINDKAALRRDDPFVPHGGAQSAPHPGKVKGGSATVTINDLPAARAGDSIDCGSSIHTGSGDVLIGD